MESDYGTDCATRQTINGILAEAQKRLVGVRDNMDVLVGPFPAAGVIGGRESPPVNCAVEHLRRTADEINMLAIGISQRLDRLQAELR